MDLQELERLSDFPRDVLRYCIDRELVPGLTVQSSDKGTGRPRWFDVEEACKIVCAASLLRSGLPARKVQHLMGLLQSIMLTKSGIERRALNTVFQQSWRGTARYGDGTFARLVIPEIRFDSDWIHAEDVQSTPKNYLPTVEIVINLDEVRCMVAPRR